MTRNQRQAIDTQAAAAIDAYKANNETTVLVWQAMATEIYLEVEHKDGVIDRIFINYKGHTLREHRKAANQF